MMSEQKAQKCPDGNRADTGRLPKLEQLTRDKKGSLFFPRLAASDYGKTSDSTPDYNCIAYAADDCARKWQWWPRPEPGYYWPPQALDGDSPEALQSAFKAIGYEVCTGHEREEGYDKVALYAGPDGTWSHAAKQRNDGQWSSKLGNGEDIRHATLMDVGDGDYGRPYCYMRRRRKETERNEEAKASQSAQQPNPPLL